MELKGETERVGDPSVETQQGQGSVLPVRKGFRVFTAWGTLTNESRLTREEAEGPRKDSGVRGLCTIWPFFPSSSPSAYLESARPCP